MRRSSLSLILALLVVLGAGSLGPTPTQIEAAASRLQQASLVLDWYPNSDHGGLFTAIQRGMFRRHGIELRAYTPSDTSAQVPLVAAGRADFGITYETDLLNARARGIPVRSLMCLVQHPLNTVMALTRSGISRPRQLMGHTVGIAGSPSDIPIVSAMVKADHGTMSKVRTINVGYSLLPALLAGKVDAVVGVYWTWEAILAREKGYPVNVMRVERWGVPNYCELVLIASEKTISQKPQFVRGTVRALQEGYAYAAAHPSAAWQALHGADKSLKQQPVLESLKLLRAPITVARTIGYQDSGQWARYARWLATNKLIPHRVNVDQVFTNAFLEPRVR